MICFGKVDTLPNPSKEQLLDIVKGHFMSQVTFPLLTAEIKRVKKL